MNNKNFAITILVLGFLYALIDPSLAAEKVSWEECLAEAKAAHPALISAQAIIEQYRANINVKKSTQQPQISTSISEKRSKTAPKVDTETYAYSISAEQLLYDGAKTQHSVNAAKQALRVAQFNYEVVSATVRNNLRKAFVKLLKAQELILLTREIYTRRKQNVELVRLRYEAGREHRGSLLAEEANLAQASFEIAQAKRNLHLAQRRLIKELGRFAFTPIVAQGNLEMLPSEYEEPSFEHLLPDIPSLQKRLAEVEEAELNLKADQADFFPKINFTSSIGRSDTQWTPRTEKWSYGVSVTLPLFEGGLRFAQIKDAQADLLQAQADWKSDRDNTIFTLVEEWNDWQDAVEDVAVKKKFLAAAGERAKIAEMQYSLGLLSFEDWTIIEDALVTAKKNYLDSQELAHTTRADWIFAQGGTLDDEK